MRGILVVMLVVGLRAVTIMGYAGETASRLDYHGYQDAAALNYHPSSFYLDAGITANFLRFKSGAASNIEPGWLGPVGARFKERTISKTTVGVDVGAGVDLQKFLLPLKVGVHYQYLGKMNFSDSRGAFETGVPQTNFARREAVAHLHLFSLNGRYEFNVFGTRIKPFVTAKAGVIPFSAKLKAHGEGGNPVNVRFQASDTDRSYLFAYGIGAGVNYNLSQKISAAFGYEYIGTNKTRMSELSGKTSMSGHSLHAGIGFSF